MTTADKPGKQMTAPKIEAQYQPRPDLSEVFSDHVEGFVYDGSTFRAEFCVRRLENLDPLKKETRNIRIPVCRLVLTPKATVDLYNKLHNLVGVLEKQGVLKKRDAKSK